MLNDRKITDWTQPVSSLDDRPQMTASALKAAFDSNTNQLKPAVNGMIDDLTGTTGAGNIGVEAIAGVTGTTVQAMLAALKALIDLCDTEDSVDDKLDLKADKTTTDKLIKTVSLDAETGVFTFTTDDGTQTTIDTMLEKIPVNCYLDGQEFVLVLDDGTEQRADLSDFLTPTEFTDSSTIDFSVSGSTVTATIKNGSITLAMLESTVISTIQGYVTAAQAAAGNASTSETNAGTYRDQAQTAATNSASSASEAGAKATLSQSWAIGGTGTRTGEDTNNSKYFSHRASTYATSAQGYSNSAMEQADLAETYKNQANSAADRAEQAAEDAEAIAGGDFIPNSQKGTAGGVATLDSSGKVPATQLPEMNYIPTSQKGAASGVASLDASGKLESTQKPDYTAGEVGAVPTTRKVNDKTLSSDITLSSDDVGAIANPAGGKAGQILTKTETGAEWGDLGAAGGSLLTITFDEALEGLPYTVAGGEESYSGTVPESLTAVHSLLAVDTDYTLTVTNAAAEKTYTRTVHTDDWYTALDVAIAPFAATITVTCPAGSSVTCANGDTTLTQTATSGTAVFTVGNTGTWTVTATLDGESASGEVVISADGESKSITLQYVHIYGVLWDGTSTTALSRTDDAAGFSDPVPAVSGGSGNSPFDTLLPWSGMVRSTDPQAGELVAIPKYWYKWTKSGSTIKLQIADGPAEGFLVSPAHCDRGDGHGERDVVYVGRYHCHTSNWKSQTGGKPKADITRSSARSSIHNLGSTIWQWDWAMDWTIKMLYLVEYADWNSQTKIGYGCGNNSSTENMGQTDGMTYHTGTKQSSRTTYGVGVQYRHIEGLWDNVYDWVDGCYYNSNGLNIILNPNNFSDSNGGTSIGTPSSGFPSALDIKSALNNQWPLPTAASGSDSTYVPDSCYFSASGPCLVVGGSYSQSLDYGLFCVSYNAAASANADIGCRLMKLP